MPSMVHLRRGRMHGMTIEVRTHPSSDIERWWEALEIPFGEQPQPGVAERYAAVFGDRLLAAMDGDRIVGTAATITFDLTIPGGRLPAAGVTGVAVQPTDRRRGVLRQMMRRLLDDARARGEPLAILWASESAIYQRFGYGMATLQGEFSVATHRSAFRDPVEPVGRVRAIDRAEAERLLPPFFESLLPHRAGFFTRSAEFWDAELFWDPEHRRHGASARRFAVYEVDGEVEAYALYRVAPSWGEGPDGRVDVREVMASTPRATKAIWRFLLDHDLMTKLRAQLLPPDPPIVLLMVEPRAVALRVIDGLWLRILDVARALGERTYQGSGALTLQLRDPMYEDLVGRWRLDVSDGRGTVARTEGEPDLELGIEDLGAMYLGEWSASTLAQSGRVVERADGALELADRLFATSLRPWCPQVF